MQDDANLLSLEELDQITGGADQYNRESCHYLLRVTYVDNEGIKDRDYGYFHSHEEAMSTGISEAGEWVRQRGYRLAGTRVFTVH